MKNEHGEKCTPNRWWPLDHTLAPAVMTKVQPPRVIDGQFLWTC